MAHSVVMPALEMAQDTGRLVKWRKREGDPVSKGDFLMDVETDKAVVEVEAEADGILSNVAASEGDVIAVGQVIAWILAPGEAAPPVTRQPATGRTAFAPSASPPAAAQTSATSRGATSERPLMSPKARRLAAEQGLDPRVLATPGAGAITAKDVVRSSSASVGEAPGTVWRLMAERMSTAWSTVPQFHLARDVDATALVAARAKLTAAGSTPDVTYTDLLVLAVARILRRHPRVNASWVGDSVRYHDDVNIGVAVAVEQGVTVPVLQGADGLGAAAIASRRAELVERARAGRLKPADLSGGRFTISNLGAHGVDAFTAIVNAPEAAILAVGAIRERIVAHEGRAVVRPMFTLTLSCDHRVLDGARGAAFLHDLVSEIENGAGVA